ncbi:MAG: DUF58 domain-containing protein [Bryobacteraceae bacterium]|nr:DUF58 domain-containing protein [Bryobacteraceae bacterium]
MTWAARWKAFLDRRIRQRVTLRGVGFMVTTIAIGVAAFVTANNLLFMLLALSLAALLVSGFVSRLGLAGLEVDLSPPDHISARVPCFAQLTVRNHKNWMPSFGLTLKGSPASGFAETIPIPLLPGGGAVDRSLTLTFPKRGRYREDVFEFSTRFPFGFTERKVRVEIERDIVVYPSVLPHAGFEELLAKVAGEIDSRRRGRGEDFHRIRPYQTNESVRYVDWKTTARTGALQVREYVEPVQPTVEIVLDLGLPPGELAWFEETVDGCAYLSWELSRRATPFRLRTQKCDLAFPEREEVYDILKFLALVEPLFLNAPPVTADVDSDDALVLVFSRRSAVRAE